MGVCLVDTLANTNERDPGVDATFWVLLAGVIIAALALLATYVTVYRGSKQLGLMDKSGRANVLLELDQRYEDILDARRAVQELEQEVRQGMATANLQGEQVFLNEITKALATMKSQQPQRYLTIKKVFDFCETVGFLMVNEYVFEANVKELWGPSIADWGKEFRLHITRRQQAEGEDIYKYFLIAAEKCI